MHTEAAYEFDRHKIGQKMTMGILGPITMVIINRRKTASRLKREMDKKGAAILVTIVYILPEWGYESTSNKLARPDDNTYHSEYCGHWRR